jgi:hypothetical protein
MRELKRDDARDYQQKTEVTTQAAGIAKHEHAEQKHSQDVIFVGPVTSVTYTAPTLAQCR